MNDTVFEWYAKYVPSGKQQLGKALLWSAAIVFLADAVLFYAFMLLPAVLAGAGAILFAGSLDYEYEYVYVNGDFTISKIIRRAKRKDVFRAQRTEIEEMVPGRRAGEKGADSRCGQKSGAVYTLRDRGAWIASEADPGFVEEMRRQIQIRAVGT